MVSSIPRQRSFFSNATADEVIEGVNLEGKTFVITGTTSGIGVETARSLALRGAHIVMLNRNLKSSEELKNKIVGEYKSAIIDSIECDLNCLKSVEKAANEVLSKEWSIHCLILNAGVCGPSSSVTSDGFESHFGVNHLAHFILIQKFLPSLRKASPSRIVILSSAANQRTGIDPSLTTAEKLRQLCPEDPSEAGWYRFYARSKMCNTLTAFKLHRDEFKNGISTYSLHPGSLIRTSIFRDSWIATIGSLLIAPFTKSISQGAATTVYCAANPDVEKVSGKHWDSCWDDEKGLDEAIARDEELQDSLWDHSEELVQKFL